MTHISFDNGCVHFFEKGNCLYKKPGKRKLKSAFSDRLYQQNPELYDKLRQKYFDDTSQWWDGDDPEKIEMFLSDFLGRNIDFIKKKKLENASSGFPYWQFYFCEKGPNDDC